LGTLNPDSLLNTSSPRARLRGVNTLEGQQPEWAADEAITSAARSRPWLVVSVEVA